MTQSSPETVDTHRIDDALDVFLYAQPGGASAARAEIHRLIAELRGPAQSPLMEATQAQHVGLPKGEPAKFVRNGKLETCQCRDCRDLAQGPMDEEIYLGLQEAKMLIGAKNDTFNEAVKASNRNKAWHILDRILSSVSSTPSQSPSQQPVAWTNEAQLGYLKDLTYAQAPMAMWASRSDSTSIPLYAAPVSQAPAQSPLTDEQIHTLERMAGHDPRVPGLTWTDNELLIQSAAQAAKDVLAACPVSSTHPTSTEIPELTTLIENAINDWENDRETPETKTCAEHIAITVAAAYPVTRPDSLGTDEPKAGQ